MPDRSDDSSIVTPRLIGWSAIVLLATFGVGWLVGGAGRSEVSMGRRAATERAEFAEASAEIRAGQLAIVESNFAEADDAFARAQAGVERLQRSWRETLQAERAGRLEIALGHLADARQLASLGNPAASNAAAAALAALAAVR